MKLKSTDCRLVYEKNEYASDALDQYSRRENVRITGIPEGEGTEENLVDKIIQVASSMGVVIDVSSFNDVHRLGVKALDKIAKSL